MNTRSFAPIISAAALIFIGLTSSENTSAQAAAPEVEAVTPLVVAELFTSQSCSSCPPAEALFSNLAEDENLLTIEWHVDYWDRLVHGGSKWKDPYSSEEFTRRQRSYNESLRGTRAVYTPQAIINGDSEGVGSRRSLVTGLIEKTAVLPLLVQIEDNTVSIGGTTSEVEVLFVRLLKQHETDVKGGENKGRKLHGKNIALSAEILGTTGAKPTQYEIPAVGTGETCAVLVQSLGDEVGPILGAVKCG